MKVGKKLYVTTRRPWRAWLKKHHASATEIWLVYYRKESGKPRIPYNDAVEEALCYGWIDSIVKKVSKDGFAQRFSPRKAGSVWSPMNIERVRRLIRSGRMTSAGRAKFPSGLLRARRTNGRARATVSPDILRWLKKDPAVWKNYSGFPASYRRIRVGWIEGARSRPEVFRQRLRYFLRMTAKNKRFGMVQ